MNRQISATIVIVLLSALASYFLLDKALASYFATNPCCIKSFLGFFSKFGISTYYLIGSFLLFVAMIKYNKELSRASLYLFSTIASSGILVIILKIIFARYRPPKFINEELYGFNWFDFGYIVNSFPSGHSTTAFSLFMALSFLQPKFKWLFLLFASLVALSRVALGVHYFSDILVGSLLGTLTSIYLYNRFYKAKV
jgi:undecaprenyl-diphosphatase